MRHFYIKNEYLKILLSLSYISKSVRKCLNLNNSQHEKCHQIRIVYLCVIAFYKWNRY